MAYAVPTFITGSICPCGWQRKRPIPPCAFFWFTNAMQMWYTLMGYSNAVQWGYGDENNLSSQTQTLNGNTYTTQYTYDRDNRLTKTTAGNVSASYTYDALGRMTGIVTKNGDSTVLNSTISYNSPSNTATSTQVADWNDGLTTYSYIYNDNGNIASISSDNRTATYEYDTLNRLTRANDPIAGKTWVYSYDSGGNILKRSEYAYTANALGTPSEEVTYSYGDSQWKDLLTAYNGKPITYDEIGNPLTYDGWTYTWQHGRQLVGMEKEGSSISNAYNTDGKRISKTVNGTTYNYHYLGDQLVEMAWGANRMHFTYDAVGPLSVNFNGTEYFYLKNAQGDVTGLVDSTGAKVVSYAYDPWGKTWDASGTLASTLGTFNPLRYRGYVYDTETGLYYLNSRYYNPTWGRFINADNQITTGSDLTGTNLFAYCGNNPVNRTDPTGEAWWHWVLGAAVVAAAAVATVVTCGGFAAAATAVCMVGSGVAAATTASTVAAGAFIGSATVYGMAVVTAASTSSSIKEFNNQGNWGTVAATAGGAILGGGSAYVSTRTPTTKVYRSVSNAEAQDIKATGQFNLAPGGMESKQFGFNLAETRQFGNMVGQNTIVSAKIPTNMLNQFYTGGVDTSIFRSGTLTVYGDQLAAFNQAVGGTIKFMP